MHSLVASTVHSISAKLSLAARRIGINVRLPRVDSNQSQACVLALMVGLVIFGVSYYARVLMDGNAGDFAWPLNAARVLLQGENPYHRMDLGPSSLPADVLLYPMPTLLLVLPFTPFSDTVALSLFLACSSALLAYLVQTRAPHAVPVILSVPFWNCIFAGQWSILTSALLLVPALSPLIVVKPTFALTALAVQPDRRRVARVCLAMGAIALITLPILWTWPLDWLHNLPLAYYERLIVALTVPGFVVCIAALRWRNPAARLLLALAFMPHFPNFYDQVALTLIPHTRRRSLAFALVSWPIFIAGRVTDHLEFATVTYYLIALGLVMTAPQSASFSSEDRAG